MRRNPDEIEHLNLSIGDLARGRYLRNFRLHKSDGSSFSVTGDTLLVVVDEYNKEKPGPYFKWKVFYENKIFFAYDEDLEVVK